MTKLKNECTPIEIARYERAYLITWDSINDTALYIQLRLNDQNLVDFAKRLELERELTRLKAELTLLEAKRQGFRAGRKAIKPPKKGKVEKAQSLADDVDELIKNSRAADQIIELSVKAIKLFNSIQAA